MAYDEALADRIRTHTGDDPDLIEKKMFGGLAFMYRGNMAVGVQQDGLMVRIAPDDHDDALAMPGVRTFDMTGRPMRGWIVVDGQALIEDEMLAHWIDRGMGYAGSLPAK